MQGREKGCLSFASVVVIWSISVLPSSAAAPGLCETYADHAISEQSRNVALGCGFTGPRWNSDRMPHLIWCLGALQQSVENEAMWRLHDLANCSHTEGGCRQYANNALADAQTNNAFGCGFGGPRYTSTEQGHLSWCIGAQQDSVDGESVGRLRDMDLCRTCNEYAGKAVSANQQNIALGCGFGGPRWNSDRQGHMPWCMGAQAQSRRNEEDARNNDLLHCANR
jgi:hypothetical protein